MAAEPPDPVQAHPLDGEAVAGKTIAGRLLEMGLTPGTNLTVVGTAPLGDPLELEVRGYRLSIRRSEAARVEILPA